MRKLIVIVLVVGVAVFGWQRLKQARNPTVIANPVYAEVRIKGDFPTGEYEFVMFVKAVDQEDCQKGTHVLAGMLTPEIKSNCPNCAVVKSECKSELAPRYAKLFDDEPTSVTYISLARNKPTDREARMLFWGVTVAESNQLCDAYVLQQRKANKDLARCIRPA